MSRWRMALTLALASCGEAAHDETEGSRRCDAAATLEAPLRVGVGDRVDLALATDGVEAWSVDTLPAGWTTLATGGDRLVLRAPWQPSAGTLSLALHCAGGSEELAIEVESVALRWTSLPTWTEGEDGPLGREYFNWWIDRAAPDRALLFGGFHYRPRQFTVGSDLWALDLSSGTWSALPAPGDPPGLAGGQVAPLPEGAGVLWYGGVALENGVPTLPFELSTLDVSSATPAFVDVPVEGAPRYGDYQPILVHDEARRRYVTLCGAGFTGMHCDVRSYDPSSHGWSSLQTTGEEPAGRNGMAWVHDRENERVVLFGGDRGGSATGCDCDDETWALELAEDPPRWVRLETQVAPPGRRNGAWAHDEAGQRLFLWGGTPDGATTLPGLWALELTRGAERWQEVHVPDGPTVRTSGGGLYDGVRRRILFGFGNTRAGPLVDLHALELAP